MRTAPAFKTEADLCRAFASCIPDGWTAYNETEGFDIVLAHENGVQIGIEAKLTLNAKVLCQAVAGRRHDHRGPDYRAVLVGKVVAENAILAEELGLTVITLREKGQRFRHRSAFMEWQGPVKPVYEIPYDCRLPEFRLTKYLPDASIWIDRDNWVDQAPTSRLVLPEYVPDVEAGHPAPQTLSHWKIQAIKVCVHAARVGKMNRAQFKALQIDASRWMTGHWMKKASERGFWEPTDSFPSEAYRRQHPEIYAQIEADYPVWSVKEGLAVAKSSEATQ